eukprot:CAMPEP_0195625802 /NCGR_PEP_ID=MMETSP0815-20121206/18044_1 /TAXON_ID=97485 /ORGANISM="Prymnesium parvum, Strain Texoma1" /LENGTH=131 /DNA_ID=CAMNT_0040766897 /DNA_START=146 /DNA_END=542 /DNA_ORIENTATION=-
MKVQMVGMIEWAGSDVCTLQGLDPTLAPPPLHVSCGGRLVAEEDALFEDGEGEMERLVPKKASANAQISESIAASCAWLVNALGCGAVYRTTGTPPSCSLLVLGVAREEDDARVVPCELLGGDARKLDGAL